MKSSATFFGAALLLAVCSSFVAANALAQGYGPAPHRFQPWRQNHAGMSSFFSIQQRQWPSGYGIRLHVPASRTGDIQVQAEGNSLRIHSEEKQQQQTLSGGQGMVFMQSSSFNQRLSLPPDADMSSMKITTRNGLIDIFIPRRK